MHGPPSIAIDDIRQWLFTWWSIRAIQTQFVAGGVCSWGYVVDDEHGRRWFLKITRNGLCGDQLNEAALRAAHSLHRDCGISEIVAPEITDSFGWVADLGEYRAALTPYVHGVSASLFQLNAEQQFMIGQLIARIHQARPRLDCYPRRERFSPRDLRPLLRRLHNYRDSSPIATQTALLLHNLRQPLLELAEALDEAQHRVVMNGSLADMFVICHGAPSAQNILLREDGGLALIDWDTCIYAPKERDLIVLMDWPAALDGYLSLVGDFIIEQDLIRFYQLQENAALILDLAGRIFSLIQNDEQNERDFAQLVAHLKGLGL